MFLLAGLGNPGAEYANTRHNAGFLALDAIIGRYELRDIGTKFHGRVWKGRIGTHDVLAVFPQTYMNRSGVSVAEAASFYHISPLQVIALHDDLDLAPATLRAKLGGGNGGHNGLRDIDRAIGVDYWRIRLGIGRPLHKTQVTSYVLGPFDEEEQRNLQPLNRSLATHIPRLLAGEAAEMMSAVARDMQTVRESS